MKQIEILIICTHQEILDTIVRLINSNLTMSGKGANTLEEAITVFRSASFDMILIGAGLTQEEESELVEAVNKSIRKIPIIYHYGGGSGLLFTEIYEGLGTSPSYDDGP